MRFTMISISFCLMTICLAGCGGGGGNGGGGGGGNGGKASIYAGTYIGAYENVTAFATGQFSFIVDSSGALTSGTINLNGSNVALTGSIKNSGLTNLQASGGNTATGTMSAPLSDTISALLTDTKGNEIIFIALANPTGAVGVGNPFSNDYTGSFTNTTKGETGVLAFYVDGSGNVSGTSLVNPSGTVELATIAGSITATGALTYTLTVNGSLTTTITGNVALANSSLTGSLLNTKGDTLMYNNIQVVN